VGELTGTSGTALGALREPRRLPAFWAAGVKLVKTKPLGAFGGAVLVAMVLLALFAEAVAPYPPDEIDVLVALKGPSAEHLLGTDNYGRDVLSRVIYGARVSLSVGVGVVIVVTVLATLLGTLSGYFGGRFDILLQRVVDAFLSFPTVILALSIMSVLPPGVLSVIIALSIRQTLGDSRTIRSAVLSVREQQYIEAARALGCANGRILSLHVLPNIMAPLIVVASLILGVAIIVEATLSFLGYGVPPPNPTWGGMLSGDGRQFMLRQPWMAFAPGLALSLAVFGVNVFGDALRDVLDPRLRGARG